MTVKIELAKMPFSVRLDLKIKILYFIVDIIAIDKYSLIWNDAISIG